MNKITAATQTHRCLYSSVELRISILVPVIGISASNFLCHYYRFIIYALKENKNKIKTKKKETQLQKNQWYNLYGNVRIKYL